MKIEGLLSDQPLAEVLRRIGQESGTGILTVQGEGDIVGVTFLAGQVVSVDAVNQGIEDGLGSVLERQGLVARDVFVGLVAEQEAGQGRVADLLLDRGLLSREQLDDALRDKSRRLCRQALGWRDGRFRFYSGQEVAFERHLRRIAVEDLLAADGERDEAVASAIRADRLDAEDFRPVVREQPWERWAARSQSSVWVALGLAAAGVIGLAAIASTAPTRVLLPLTAQRGVEESLQQLQRSAFYAKVDRAAKTYFLLEGSFPDALGQLVEERLLAPSDLGAPQAGEPAYADAPASYLLRLQGDAEMERKSHRTETVAGHFLLDSAFVVPEVIDFPPLVLLD